MPADGMAEHLGITLSEHRAYETVVGLIISELQRLPAVGEKAEVSGCCFEVVDLDGRRIDKVLARCLEPQVSEVLGL